MAILLFFIVKLWVLVAVKTGARSGVPKERPYFLSKDLSLVVVSGAVVSPGRCSRERARAAGVFSLMGMLLNGDVSLVMWFSFSPSSSEVEPL